MPSLKSTLIRPKVRDRTSSSRQTTFAARPDRRLATKAVVAVAMPAAARGVAPAGAVSVAILAQEQMQVQGHQEARMLLAEIRTGVMTEAQATTVRVTRLSPTR